MRLTSLKRKGMQSEYNHFRLIDLTREELYDMGVTAIVDDGEEQFFILFFLCVCLLMTKHKNFLS